MSEEDATHDFVADLKAAAEARLAGERKQGGLKDLQEGRGESYFLNPYLISVEEGWNSRDFGTPEKAAHIAQLAKLIAEHGFLRQHPVVVRWKGGRPVLLDGECRWRATLRAIEHHGAQIKGMWAVTAEKNASDLDLLAAQATANTGLRFTPLELAAHYKRMLAFTAPTGNVAEVARMVGKSPAAVQRLLDLHSAPEEAKARLRAGEVSADVVLDALRAAQGDRAEAAAQVEAAVEVAKANGARRATKRHARAAGEGHANISRRTPINRAEIQRLFQESEVQPRRGYTNESIIIIHNADLARLREVFGF